MEEESGFVMTLVVPEELDTLELQVVLSHWKYGWKSNWGLLQKQ